jgi:hypothetical protein
MWRRNLPPVPPDEDADDYYDDLGRFDKRREKLSNAGSPLDADNDSDTQDAIKEWNEWQRTHGTDKKSA